MRSFVFLCATLSCLAGCPSSYTSHSRSTAGGTMDLESKAGFHASTTTTIADASTYQVCLHEFDGLPDKEQKCQAFMEKRYEALMDPCQPRTLYSYYGGYYPSVVSGGPVNPKKCQEKMAAKPPTQQ